ncbi:MAG TPA: hypothetical protein VER96_12345 [Polyangiaceae bacterium]|nr:hypothetical protein [Polyangiaceae bacterium]
MPGHARQNEPECQVLFELFGSPRGKVSLGRLSSGKDVGRIVMLRQIPEGTLRQATPAFDLAKSLAHPRLLKLLGVVSDRSHRYVASEYVPGVSLFELVARTRARQHGMAPGAAVRVMIDALRAVASARSLLTAAGAAPVRLLNSDCVWLVDYGEILLSEVGVSAALLGGPSQRMPDTASDVDARDVMTAAVELYQLASGRLMTGDLTRAAKLHLPVPLARVLEEAFTGQSPNGADGVGALADALAALPPVLVGREQEVVSELQRTSGDLLEERRRKLAAFRSGSMVDIEGATRIFAARPIAEEEAEEEATLAVPYQRPVPRMLAVPALSTVTRTEPESHRPQRASSEPPPLQAKPRPRSRLLGLSRREWWLLAVWFMLALVMIAWQRRDWLSSAIVRLNAWSSARSD